MNFFSSIAFQKGSYNSCNDESIQTHEEKTNTNADSSLSVGGQAVLEGIMMRYKEHYALAVRMQNSSIYVERKKWYNLNSLNFFRKPYLRGFPILLETMINGIKTLNRSAELSSIEDEKPITPMQLTFTLITALIMAIGLFVVLPHGLSFLLGLVSLSGNVDSFSFQVWDGLFKFLIFFLYLFAISFFPEIKRVFQFHGAEHKVISAYENAKDNPIDLDFARLQSRLHPRCGTTFLLFVLSIAIIVHTVILPLFLWIWMPESALVTHIFTLFIKIVLMIPISALAYELIKYAAKLNNSLGTLLKQPGLLLQRFTTIEPEDEHIEVALVALKVALGDESKHTIITKEYSME